MFGRDGRGRAVSASEDPSRAGSGVQFGPAPSLQELQRSFAALLLHDDERVLAHVAGGGAAPAVRLNVYGTAYRLRLLEALEIDFPALRATMGEAGFAGMGRAYIDACPSRHFSIRWFGRRLPQFLAAAAPWRRRPGLAAAATFEWTLGEAFDAEDAPRLERDTLAALPPAAWHELRLRLHPSVRLLELDRNAPAWWRAWRRGRKPLPPPAASPAPIACLIWRQDLSVHFRSVTAAEAAALHGIASGETFSRVCGRLCAHLGEDAVPAYAAERLAIWTAAGIFSGITLN